jgi:hypothetical protein
MYKKIRDAVMNAKSRLTRAEANKFTLFSYTLEAFKKLSKAPYQHDRARTYTFYFAKSDSSFTLETLSVGPCFFIARSQGEKKPVAGVARL